MAADAKEEEFAVNAPKIADSDPACSQNVMASWHVSLPKGRGHLHQGYVAAVDQKSVTVISLFCVWPLELLPGASAANDSLHTAEPCQNPLSGNIILCHQRQRVNVLGRGGDIFIEEFESSKLDDLLSSSPSSPVTGTLACISIDEIKAKLSQKFSTGVGVKVLGISLILSLAASVHRVQDCARVCVAVLVEVYITPQEHYLGAGSSKIRIVAVWQWGYNPSGITLTLLQSVLTMDSINGEESNMYDPKTLKVAGGLLFLGGNLAGCITDSNEVTTMASIFITKPAVRHSWTAVPLQKCLLFEYSNACRYLQFLPVLSSGYVGWKCADSNVQFGSTVQLVEHAYADFIIIANPVLHAR